MNCREFVEFLMAYLERELPDDEQRSFEGHLEACPSCVNYLESYRETVRLGRELCGGGGDEAVPDDVPEELVQAILAARRS